MEKRHLSITAARHPFGNAPLRVDVSDLLTGGDMSGISLKDTATGELVPTQLMEESGRQILYFAPDAISLGKAREYEVIMGMAPLGSGVSLADVGGKVEVRIDGNICTAYVYGGDIVRPFLYPLIGPGEEGITRNFPMVKDVTGESTDHKHHRSVWVAYGDVNGADDWSEEEGHASIKHREFQEMISGPVFGRIKTVNDWLDKDGKKLMEEFRAVTIYNLPKTGRMIDFRIKFRASEGDVRFGDTKEGGIISVRVATSMDGNKGGRITNAYGGVTEKETWGKPSHWCDYSGQVNGRMVGIAIFDNPRNFRYPTAWHVRDYGLFTANPFALSAYSGDPKVDGSHIVKAGESFSFAYRLYIHDGDAKAGGVADQFHGYISPPKVEIK
jgi:hypothetical protein